MPSVFISYSHENDDHNKWVINLAASLRKKGVEAAIDKWDLKPGQDMTHFMESQITDADFVILVCTPKYAKKSNKLHGGVGFEKNIISAEMLQSKQLEPKYIPILRKGTFENALPIYIKSKRAIDFRDDSDFNHSFEDLLRTIFKQPHPSKPPLGVSPFIPESRTDEKPNKYVEVKSPVKHLTKAVLLLGIDNWEKKIINRFLNLSSDRFKDYKSSLFKDGFWQASFLIGGGLSTIDLKNLLSILYKSAENLNDWAVWIPDGEKVTPYPYENGIEFFFMLKKVLMHLEVQFFGELNLQENSQ